MSQINNIDNLLIGYQNIQMFSKKEVAKILSVSLSTIDNYLGSEIGKLNYLKFDSSKKSTIRILRSDLIKFISDKYKVKDAS